MQSRMTRSGGTAVFQWGLMLSAWASCATAHAEMREDRGPSGATCSDPITLTLPAAIPYSDSNTTCGMVNDFEDPCIGPHGEGEDVIYELTVTETLECVKFELTASGGYASMSLDDSCPGDGNCIAATADFGGSPTISMQAPLAAGTYYLVIDSWAKFASCVPSYSLSITVCQPEVWACCLDGMCLGDMTQAACGTQGGLWLPGASCNESNVCPPVCEPDALVGQSVVPAPYAFTAGTSDANSPFSRYESYSVNADICAVTWWGVKFDEPPCMEENMEFEITFYEDDGGMPGAAVCSYAVMPEEIEFSNPYSHNYGGYWLHQWNVELPQCCTLHNGWISIRGTSLGGPPDCWFGWLESNMGNDGSSLFDDSVSITPQPYDLSFCLYGGGADCPGDIVPVGGNNAVDVFDLLELLQNWNTSGPGAAIAPPTDVVNIFDLLELLSTWGPC